MSKSSVIKMSLVAVIAAATPSAMAHANGATASESVGSAAFVLANLQVTSSPIDFGRFTASTTAGSVVIGANQASSGTNGVTLIGGSSAGELVIAGTANQNVSLAISSVSSLTGPGTAMSLNDVAFSNGSATLGASPTLALDNSGSKIVKLFGSLAVGANQTPGVYSGTVDVVVTYV